MDLQRFSDITVCIAVLCTAACSMEDSDAKKTNYYPITKGRTWVYRGTIDGEDAFDRVITVHSLERKAEQTTAKILDSSISWAVGSMTIVSDDKGVYEVGEGYKEQLLRYPVKAGDSWTTNIKTRPGYGLDRTVKTNVIGEVPIKVPAGEYKAIEVRSVSDDKRERIESITWYADQVGIVKQKVSWKGVKDEKVTLEVMMELKRLSIKK